MNRNQLANIQVLVGLASVLVGTLLIFGPGTRLFSSYELSIAAAIGVTNSITASQANLIHWLLATCGAGVVGWGIAWTMISHIPLRRGESWAYRCLWISLATWALLDLLIAWWFGVTGEIVFVLCAFLAAALPLILGWRTFTDP
ncbi:MAG: hypothetical protein ACR2PZ_07570 [Pseudomonadales bacterium]